MDIIWILVIRKLLDWEISGLGNWLNRKLVN